MKKTNKKMSDKNFGYYMMLAGVLIAIVNLLVFKVGAPLVYCIYPVSIIGLYFNVKHIFVNSRTW